MQAESSIERWQRAHPGVDTQRYAVAWAALEDIQSDWAYRNGPLNLPERYEGEFGWWL